MVSIESRSNVTQAVVDRWPPKNRSKQTNAEDNTSDLLAEAEYIINHSDEFLVDVEDEILAVA